MNGKTFVRLATAAAACGLSAAATFGSAVADPTPAPDNTAPAPNNTAPAPNNTAPASIDAAAQQLTTVAGTDPGAAAGIGSLVDTTHMVQASKLDHVAGGFTPFLYQAPTFGCGSNLPVSLTAVAGAAGVPGPDRGVAGQYATVRFQASPNTPGFPVNSGLTVAWFNTGNGRSGVTPLDENSEFGTPELAKTVDTGPGTVVASMWGTIGYPGSTCVMTPTVGVITVYPNPHTDPYAPGPPDPDRRAPQVAPGN